MIGAGSKGDGYYTDTIQLQESLICRIATAKPIRSHLLSIDGFFLQSSDVHFRCDMDLLAHKL